MDHHMVAAVSIAGTCLDVIGSLYLAYDLLGGQHGPLRLITRAVTYSIVFGVGYGVGLGLFFGLVPRFLIPLVRAFFAMRANHNRALPHKLLRRKDIPDVLGQHIDGEVINLLDGIRL